MDIFANSAHFAVTLSLVLFLLGAMLQKKWNIVLLNPLILSTAGTIAVLLALDIPYETYEEGTGILKFFLTPATVCLAVPLYEKMDLLKKHPVALLTGSISGVILALGSIFILSLAWGLESGMFATLLPKSITTAIAMELSGKLGGVPAVAATGVMVTGIFGYVTAVWVLKLCRITDPIARGVAIGTSCHVIGTSRALEIGETEGAMSSLSLSVAGVVTALFAPLFMNLYNIAL